MSRYENLLFSVYYFSIFISISGYEFEYYTIPELFIAREFYTPWIFY